MHESEKWKRSRSVVSDSSWPHGLQPNRLLLPWEFPGKSTGVGCHCLHAGRLDGSNNAHECSSWEERQNTPKHFCPEAPLFLSGRKRGKDTERKDERMNQVLGMLTAGARGWRGHTSSPQCSSNSSVRDDHKIKKTGANIRKAQIRVPRTSQAQSWTVSTEDWPRTKQGGTTGGPAGGEPRGHSGRGDRSAQRQRSHGQGPGARDWPGRGSESWTCKCDLTPNVSLSEHQENRTGTVQGGKGLKRNCRGAERKVAVGKKERVSLNTHPRVRTEHNTWM